MPAPAPRAPQAEHKGSHRGQAIALCDYCVATSMECTMMSRPAINQREGIMKHHRSLLVSSICLAATLLIVPGAAQSQSLTPNVTYSNPPTMPKPPGYTQV